MQCRDAICPTAEQQRLGQIPQSSALTFHLSGPEQLAEGNGVTLLSNDHFNVGAATLELLLGKERFGKLLVAVNVPGYAEAFSCLFPPGDAALQQQQMVRIKGP
jgi:hypothetical protein